jgi:hypothetical protein
MSFTFRSSLAHVRIASNVNGTHTMGEPRQSSYVIAYIIVSGLILGVGHFLQFDFVAFVLVGMFAGRKVCWWTAIPLPLTIVLCLGWGALIGFALHSLFREFNPGTIPKVFAYGAGAYVSVPNYGLIAEASISEGTAFQGRHLLLQVVPCLAFVGASLWLVLA